MATDNTPHPADHHTAADLLPTGLRRFIPLLGVVGITLAVVGFVSGLREPGRVPRPPLAERSNTTAPAAVSYAELSAKPLGPNANRRQSLADLKYDRPGIFDPVVGTPEQMPAALADRARNRAYDGAPPTIPHPVSTDSANGCLACHGEGLKVGDRIASKMSHAMMTNCTQCHVEQSPQPVSVETRFAGLLRSGPGERANPSAPPTTPHHTWMRENCNSCHGTVARPGLRSTHPWLTNCQQCHAPSATHDRRDFTEARR